jgi:hypothetical protein
VAGLVMRPPGSTRIYGRSMSFEPAELQDRHDCRKREVLSKLHLGIADVLPRLPG